MQRYAVYFIWKLLYMFRAVTSGAHTTVSTESGICHTVTATSRYRGRVGTGLSVLKPTPTLIVEELELV
jgi:hypothetical protein